MEIDVALAWQMSPHDPPLPDSRGGFNMYMKMLWAIQMQIRVAGGVLPQVTFFEKVLTSIYENLWYK